MYGDVYAIGTNLDTKLIDVLEKKFHVKIFTGIDEQLV